MSQAGNIVFFNGELRPESEVGIPIRDRGYIYGDAVFDATRTFNGKPFRLRDHIRRLYDSLRYLRIDPGIDADAIERWSLEVVDHNYPLLPANQDLWVMQRISRGIESHRVNRDPRNSFCQAGGLISGRHKRLYSFHTPRASPFHESPSQNPQLLELDPG